MGKLQWKEALKKGIRASDKSGRNNPTLFGMFNRRPGRYGDEEYVEVVRPFVAEPTGGIDEIPVVIRTSFGDWFLADTALYPMTLDKEDGWTLAAAATVYNRLLGATVGTLPGTGRWHVASMYRGWVAFRSGCVLWTTDGTNFTCHTTGPKTGCVFRGRMFYGNLLNFFDQWSSYGYFTDWLSAFTLYQPASAALESFKHNMVYMCGLDGRDIRWWLYPNLAIDAGLSFNDYELGISNADWTSLGAGWSATGPGGYSAQATAGAVTATNAVIGGTASADIFVGNYYRLDVFATVTAGTVTIEPSSDIEEFMGPETITATGNYVYFFRYAPDKTSWSFTFNPATTFQGVVSLKFWRKGTVEADEHDQFDIGKRANIWMDLASTNDCGFYHMAWKGAVLKTLPLKNHVMVYGEDGITALSANGTVVMSVTDVAKYGIASRDAVAGGDFKHLFMTTEGELVFINNGLELQVLGYKEFFTDLVEDTSLNSIVITWDETWDDFYVNDVTSGRTFLVTDSGMAEIAQQVWQMIAMGMQGSDWDAVLGSHRVGVAGALSASNSEWTSDVFDMGTSDAKLVTRIYAIRDMGYEGDLTLRVYFRDSYNTAHSVSASLSCDAAGAFDVNLTGIDFYWELTATGKDLKLHDVLVEFEDAKGRSNLKSYFKVS